MTFPESGVTGLYGYAVVGRYGLAHSLLAWARCWLWCQERGVPMLAPDWRHLRIGPLLRGERDSRQYHRLFKFDDYVRGLRRAYLLQAAKRIPAESCMPAELTSSSSRRILVFKNRLSLNEETHFQEVVGRAGLVRDALTAMTRPKFRPAKAAMPHIALHVRMGDFGHARSLEELRAGAKNSRLPVSWYRSMLQGLRAQLGDVPAIVYSDGNDESLAALLTLKRVQRAPAQPSVTDLLSLAQAQLVISSGSGFSMWGAYLGNAPRICFPGQRLIRVLGEQSSLDCEPEAELTSDLSNDFIKYINSRLLIG